MLDTSRTPNLVHRLLAYPRTSAAVIITASTLVALLSVASPLHAHSTGIVGYAKSVTGCFCHSPSANANGAVSATISGPKYVSPGSTNSYAVTVSGGPNATSGGFDLRVESAGVVAGTLIPGPGTQVLSGELTHSNSSSRSWSFQWTAPAQEGAVDFYLIAQACNGNGTNQGDSWNWCGNTQAAAQAVTISSLTGVEDPLVGGGSLLDAWPNPFTGSNRFAISLPRADRIHLEVFDAQGHHVTTLLDGELAAGRHIVAWDGRDQGGRPAPPGCYAARLRTASGTYCRKLVRAR